MNMDKFSMLFGSIFAGAGFFALCIGIILNIATGDALGLLITVPLALVFIGIGVGFIMSVINAKRKADRIQEKGTKYTGKIYSYTDDTSLLVNGQYRVNIKVRFFDKNGVEREALVPTKFIRGNGDFPIGATIDICEFDGKYTWVKGSVRYEQIYREEELMDDKPLEPGKINMVGISCQGCGASFTGAKGYVSRCPYCGAAINVE